MNNVNAGKFEQAAELQNTFQISDVTVNPIIVPIIKSKLQTKNLDSATVLLSYTVYFPFRLMKSADLHLNCLNTISAEKA